MHLELIENNVQHNLCINNQLLVFNINYVFNCYQSDKNIYQGNNFLKCIIFFSFQFIQTAITSKIIIGGGGGGILVSNNVQSEEKCIQVIQRGYFQCQHKLNMNIK